MMVSGSSISDIFFDSELAGIPQDLGIRILAADITSSDRYNLIKLFKVKDADSQQVANRILELHRGRTLPKSLVSLINHAMFMFTHSHFMGSLRPWDFE